MQLPLYNTNRYFTDSCALAQLNFRLYVVLTYKTTKGVTKKGHPRFFARKTVKFAKHHIFAK